MCGNIIKDVYIEVVRARINTVNTVMLDSKEPIFIQIKNYYERLIDIGALKDGQEMPSVREVALLNNVNPNTVQRAFSLMVDDGYLISIPKKGFYVKGKDINNKNLHLKETIDKLIEEGYTFEEILNEVKGREK